MSNVIGNMHAVLGLDSSAFQRGIAQSTAGLKKIKVETSGVQQAMVSFQATMRALGATLGAVGLAMGVRAIGDMADDWSDLSSRVGLAVGSMDQASAVMNRLADIADRTYSGLNQTAEGFLQNATTLRDLGLSTAQALDYTESLNNAMVVSGAKGDQAARVQRSLSNAMALGALRGDNLNTILTAGGRVAELLAEEMGVSTLELRKLGQQGKLTGDVILRALIGNMELLREEAEEMPATIGDGFVRIGNAMQRLVGSFDQFFGASESVSGALIALAENLGRIMSYVAAAVVGFGVNYVVAVTKSTIANFNFAASLVALRGALIRTGIGALIVAAGEMVYQFGRLVSATGSFGGALTALGDLSKLVWQGIIDSAKAIPPGLSGTWSLVESGFAMLISNLSRMWSDFLASIVADTEKINMLSWGDKVFWEIDNPLAAPLAQARDDAARFSDEMRARAGEASAAMAESFGTTGKIIADAFAPVADAWGNLKTIADDAKGALNEPLPPGLGSGADDSDGKKGKKGRAERPFFEGVEESMRSLRRQIGLVGKTREEAAALQARWEMLDEAKRRGIPVNEKLNSQIEGYAAQVGALTGELERAEIAQQQFDQAVDGIADAFAGALVAGESLRDGLGQVFKQIAADLMRSRVLDMLKAISGSMGWGGDSLSNALRGAGLPAFASGGSHQGGWRIVGEHGPELEATGAARYWTAGQTRNMLAGGGGAVNINVNVEGANGDQHVIQLVQQGVSAGLRSYDQGLPDRMSEINSKSRWR